MKLQIKTNLSFSNLASRTHNIIYDYISKYAKGSEEGSREKIDRGLRAIRPVTKKIRKWRKEPESPPLKASGALYKSLKAKDRGLEMLEYGILHHDGFTTDKKSLFKGFKIKARPFISITSKYRNKIHKELIQDMKKALRK